MSTNPAPVPVSLFLLNPKNEAFVNGRAPAPDNENPTPILLLKLVGTVSCAALIGYWQYKFLTLKVANGLNPIWPLAMAAFLGALVIFIFYSTLAPIVRNRPFLTRCQVLYGELAECKQVDDDGTIDWRVTYRFHSPAGRMIEGKWTTEGTVTRVEQRPKPAPGIRIAIAYIDDKTHRML